MNGLKQMSKQTLNKSQAGYYSFTSDGLMEMLSLAKTM